LGLPVITIICMLIGTVLSVLIVRASLKRRKDHTIKKLWILIVSIVSVLVGGGGLFIIMLELGWRHPLGAILCAVVFLLVFVSLGLFYYSGSKEQWDNDRSVLLPFFIGLVVMSLSLAEKSQGSGDYLAFTVSATVVLFPSFEELVFRGLLYDSFIGADEAWGKFIFFSIVFSMLFVAMHITSNTRLINYIELFALSIVCFFARRTAKSRSIIASVYLHSMYNIAVFVLVGHTAFS
jgi:membrane protease YdiL (CAAX protease family)